MFQVYAAVCNEKGFLITVTAVRIYVYYPELRNQYSMTS